MKLGKTFIFYGTETESVFGYPFQDKGFSGVNSAVMKKAVRKHPEFSVVLKLLILSNVAFFYDSVLNKFHIIAQKNVDINAMSEYITKYYTEIKNVTLLDQFCKDNRISNFTLPKTEENIIQAVVDFLSENNLEL